MSSTKPIKLEIGKPENRLVQRNFVKSLGEKASEARREELNRLNGKNQRLKMGLSKKNWKRLKKFHEAHIKVMENLVANFYTDIATAQLELDSPGVDAIFEKYDTKWRNWVRPQVNKLKLHSKEGRSEVFEKFTDFVRNTLKDVAVQKTAQQEKRQNVDMDSNTGVELISIALRHGATKESINLKNCPTFKEVVKDLKQAIPRGGKMKFEKEANDYLDKQMKSIRLKS